MPPDDYRRALDAAVKDYERAMADRAALDARIAQLHETIRTLTKLCGFTPTVPFGLTDACRLVLRNAGAPLSAVQVRERLTAMGFDHEKYANGLAAIHTVLKRLQESGEAALAAQDDVTRLAYEFLGSGIVASRVGPRPAVAARGPSRRHAPRGSMK